MSKTKCTSTHTTHLEVAKDLLKFAQKSSLVNKISLGIITPTPKSRGGISRRIKCIPQKACLLLKIRGNRGVQEIRFYSEDLEKLQQEILDLAKELGFETS